ncbi:MAG: shikimate dehydrogenase [Alphaproteobacteria bacterium]|nr:shikimate dehydrogenase [Alphaproteobacteria bacterium]MBV9694134.1 shikimate dehydrogenase [Alphaproteobacteria bacterium]
MRTAAVLGWPVTQSLSPHLHGYWLREHRIDGAYIALPVQRENFSRVVEGLILAGSSGASVTLPHKEAAFAIAHSVDSDARAARAVNQLVFRDAKIHGLNTDVAGLTECLHAAKVDIAGKPVVLIGAGGAARAAVLALRKMGASEIRALNRTPQRAQSLGTGKWGGLDEWSQAAMDVALVLNTSSAGMKGEAPVELDLRLLPASAAICDIVYNPLQTALLAAAQARGLKTVDGLGMLMHQAVPAFEAFFGVRPAVTPALRRALETALSHG